ncbi:MAG: cytochrome c peroxidase [Acidimicrobiales bacterium]
MGRLLFFDPIVSGKNDMSCAHCHHPDTGLTDRLPKSRGTGAVGIVVSASGCNQREHCKHCQQ